MLSDAYITRQFYAESPLPAGPYCLVMHISSHAFMYAVSTDDFKNVVELAHLELSPANNQQSLAGHISLLVQNFQLHQKKFEKVNVLLLNSDFTMLPEAFALPGELKPILNFATGSTLVKSPLVHHLKGMGFCFTPDDELLGYLERTFTNAAIRHAGAVNIALLFSQHSLSGSQVFLNINEGLMELAVKGHNGLQFYNVFNYQTNEDVLYYLLFTMEQLGLDPLLVKLSVGGQVAPGDDLVKNLKKYIKQVAFCVSDPSVILKEELLRLPQHYYFTLLNQHLCAL